MRYDIASLCSGDRTHEKRPEQIDDPRRALLLQMLVAGMFAISGVRPALAGVLGRTPQRLPAGKSIYFLDGDVRVNSNAATLDTLITASDTVATGVNGRIVFVVGEDAVLLRPNSQLQLAPAAKDALLDTLRILSGRVLTVFGKRAHNVTTATATLGIRGTGLYVEADPEQTYACTCYGTVDMAAIDDPGSQETIESKHHDAPRYILAAGSAGERIRPAPFINHTDEELEILETLVGRRPPFTLPGDSYSAPRRTDY